MSEVVVEDLLDERPGGVPVMVGEDAAQIDDASPGNLWARARELVAHAVTASPMTPSSRMTADRSASRRPWRLTGDGLQPTPLRGCWASDTQGGQHSSL